jgi:fatty-acyl-CoA synthase
VLTAYPGIVEANVYGVAVPGTDGRAGMAAIVIDRTFDLTGLCTHLAARLPGYAHPLFLRIRRAMDITATFKHRKAELAQAGYDPAQSADAIYFNDRERGSFVRLDAPLFARIQSRQVRL